MSFCSDDVHRMTVKSSARIHRGRRVVHRGPIRANLQYPPQGNRNTAFGETNLRIPSTRLFNRNETYSNIDLLKTSSKPGFSTLLCHVAKQ
ncbi:unnamed protein product [Protopolystoma xenopodis]|uniref:Uncharacterized protein n=1 Tax=Protopolystoma xenopodis TaxID=117903 RepID=A0A3S5FDR2_9PLAT|nr:unnamed protein product [Protopolystoma xenopodis]